MRYSFTCCQEMFKICPRNLADVTVNNDRALLEPARQTPEAGEVKRLFRELCSRTWPRNPVISGSRASELLLCENFSPITVEEIDENSKENEK
jgi:hypothetical protein